MTKIKWGIVGPGVIARQFAHDFQFCEYAELIGVASRNLDRAKSFSKEFEVPRVYGSYHDLYEDPEIDAIYVATPHNFHFQNSKDAIRFGKAVLCEKPLTVNPTECRDLIKVARDENMYLMEGMWTYFLPAINQALSWVDQGRLGEIRHVKADFGYPVPYDPESRMYNPKLAGGSLLDMGVYTVAMAWLFFKDDPKQMNVVSRKSPEGVDVDVSMTFDYGDALASLVSSFRVKLHNYAFVIGTNGYIMIPDFWRANECFLYEGDTVVDHFNDDRKGYGFNFETDTASLDILAGKKESDIMPHSFSLKFQEHMDRVMTCF